jgi:uncharacterized protein (DUF302 family)
MHFISRCITKNFPEAMALAKRALERHGFAIVREFDIRQALQAYAPVDQGPCVILNTCCPALMSDALSVDEEIGPQVLTNIVVRQRRDGVEISVVDPATTIGTVNHVVMIQMAGNLRCRLQAAFEEMNAECAAAAFARSVVEPRAESAGALSFSQSSGVTPHPSTSTAAPAPCPLMPTPAPSRQGSPRAH